MDPFALVSSPWVAVSMLPWVLLFGWLARRLLGARHVGTRAALLTSVVGYLAGLLFAQLLTEGIDSPGFLLAGTVFTVGFIMVATVGLELAATTPTDAPLSAATGPPSAPHPIRGPLQRTQHGQAAADLPDPGPARARRRPGNRRAQRTT